MSVTNEEPGLFRYIVDHDMGFAPNPFFGPITLACCKPRIRRKARKGDFIVGYGSAKGGNRGQIVYWMVVDEITDFERYWADPRFALKRPKFGTSLALSFGDNIYHRCSRSGKWIQEKSFHSDDNSLIGLGNLKRDTGTTEKVLIGHEFTYWGGSGPVPPAEFLELMQSGVREIHVIKNRALADQFIKWLKSIRGRGYQFDPAMWSTDKKIRRFWKPEAA